ncbi:MAG TPA: hypothetical protein VK636_09220 [Gemmatimonadaceae bacterium]|nr:hypothetical protein [Gemmatimonadaceae bacterium]
MSASIRARLAIIAITTVLTVVTSTRLYGQTAALQSPFLFATRPPTTETRLATAVDAGYNARAFEPVAGERLEPRATALVTLSRFVAVQGQFAAASTLDHRTRVAEQMELMVTPIRRGSLSLGTNIGMRHEYTGTNVLLARLVGGRTTERSALAADVLLEHPYAAGRDGADVVTTIGATRALTSRLWLGVEAVGSDLEGLWDSEEAEGGATVLVGPTFAVAMSDRVRLVFGGGPVLRATTDKAREDVLNQPSLLLPGQRTGYVIRTSLRVGW